MRKDLAVKLHNISKVYKLYDKTIDRLKESLHPLKKKYYKEFHALKNINLEIKKGEVLGIVGVNGAGKSTLLKIIAGVMTPTTGRVVIHGRVNAILELGSALKSEMTGRENIRLNLQINGIERDRENITQEIIDFADIGEHLDQPVKTYSSGMRARLGFAIATSTDPDVLIVDEVLAVGDVLFQRKCHVKIEQLFNDGKTVIFVSHSAQSVIEFCSRAVLLYDKEIILDSDPKKVTDFYQKLVFSKDHSKVLDEIKGKQSIDVQQTEIQIDKNRNIETKIQIDNNFYLSSLKAKSMEYKNYDVEIFDAMILNKIGKKVNVLVSGQAYVYTHKVKFNDSFENVAFGFEVKTGTGLKIASIESGKVYKQKQYLRFVKTGSIYVIQYPFIAKLTPGIYFVNNGVSSFMDEQKILNRIIDIFTFKVKENDSLAGGYCQLINEKEIKIEKY